MSLFCVIGTASTGRPSARSECVTSTLRLLGPSRANRLQPLIGFRWASQPRPLRILPRLAQPRPHLIELHPLFLFLFKISIIECQKNERTVRNKSLLPSFLSDMRKRFACFVGAHARLYQDASADGQSCTKRRWATSLHASQLKVRLDTLCSHTSHNFNVLL